jgi:hypothetical protein
LHHVTVGCIVRAKERDLRESSEAQNAMRH